MTTLLLVPLEDVVVFPNMTVTLPVDVGDEKHVLLVPVHEGEYASVGTVAEVVEAIYVVGQYTMPSMVANVVEGVEQ